MQTFECSIHNHRNSLFTANQKIQTSVKKYKCDQGHKEFTFKQRFIIHQKNHPGMKELSVTSLIKQTLKSQLITH